MRLEPDPWLAKILGHDVYRVICGTPSADISASAEALHDALSGARRQATFYYAKVPSQAVDQVRVLCGAGFFVVDVNVTFERTPDASSPAQPRPGIVVRDMRPTDHTVILDVAEHCFSYSRFHLDPFFRREQANHIKREWIRNYILGRRGERLLIAESDSVPVGFLAVLAADIKGCSCRLIDLIGVSDSHQGRGIGRELVDSFKHLYAGKCDLLRVGTQVANTPSARLYERCGFCLVESAYVLHAHVRDGKLLR
jgi:dTDP-4-amino-4,6-dideoxy-D-galactose acyltransferase